MSLVGLLGLLFVGLKLTGYIDWSWFYVTMLFWIGIVIFMGSFLIGAFGIAIFGGQSRRRV